MSRHALPLTGYESASVWGFDTQASTYYAQLWRNTSDSWDDPDIWLSGLNPIDSPSRLAELIAGRTGSSVGDVLRAMAAASSAPEAPALAQLANGRA
jgi:hypothetical protein